MFCYLYEFESIKKREQNIHNNKKKHSEKNKKLWEPPLRHTEKEFNCEQKISAETIQQKTTIHLTVERME